MERSIYIKKFRNIGMENAERIVLNRTLEKGKMGNLVILIGSNNSGKSNVLDALTTFQETKFKDRDKTNLYPKEEYKKPCLQLACKDGEDEYKLTYEYNEKPKIYYPKMKSIGIDDINPIFMDDINILNDIINYINRELNMYGYGHYHELSGKFYNINNDMVGEDKKKKFFEELKVAMNKLINGNNRNYKTIWKNVSTNYSNTKFVQEFSKIDDNINHNLRLNEIYMEKYGVNFVPHIEKYEESKFSNSHLICTVSSLKTEQSFFRTLFNCLGININEVLNAYSELTQNNYRGAITKIEREINEKMKDVIKYFNDLYFCEQEKYDFRLKLETHEIYFEISRQDIPLSLDLQSTGFKWFFNLYFSFLAQNKFKPGDVVIMDEPATNLHYQGQVELRKFLKEFAMKNDLTIVLATHCPALIDLDYLDELRIITSKNGEAIISNDFHAIDHDSPETLKPIIDSLTVKNHILIDPDKTVVFVEGITDYNYLTLMKTKLNKEDLLFIPINGIGKDKDQQKEIISKILKMKKHSPMLLVDSDKAGKSIKKLNDDMGTDLTIVSLKEAKEEFVEIESLFSDADAKLLGIVDENSEPIKHAHQSAIIKTFSDDITLSEETIKNFELLFQLFD